MVSLLAAFDFWTVQNVTGRLLVGMRWRSALDEQGKETWVYEISEEKKNATDMYVFWITLFVAPSVWGLFVMLNFFTFKLFWNLLAMLCFGLCGIHLIAYIKCYRSSKGPLISSSMMSKAISAAISIKV